MAEAASVRHRARLEQSVRVGRDSRPACRAPRRRLESLWNSHSWPQCLTQQVCAPVGMLAWGTPVRTSAPLPPVPADLL